MISQYGLEFEHNGLARDQRLSWRKCLEEGQEFKHHMLEEYRENRDNPSWRGVASVEALCEYVLYLESRIEEMED